jgi:hypothetical protein
LATGFGVGDGNVPCWRLATSDWRLISYRESHMSAERLFSTIALVWFFVGALCLLAFPVQFIRFASLGTRPSLTSEQLRKARIVGVIALVLACIILLEFAYGFIR